MAVQYNPGIVTNGLVLYLDAANRKSYPAAGNTWTDLITINNTLSMLNGTTFNSSNFGSIVFDGVDDYGTIPNNSSLNITSQISLETWIYPTKNSGVQNVISKSSSGQNNSYIYPRTDNGWANSVFYLNTGSWRTVTATWPGLNRWSHTVGTYDGTTMRIYINGSLSSSIAASGSITTNTNSLAIGVQPGYNEYYGGRIANAKIYNIALTSEQILQNFNALRGRFGI